MEGRVTAFDERRGLGTITVADGREYPFHCTQIAGDSRTIARDTTVTFETMPGHLGRIEATAITPG